MSLYNGIDPVSYVSLGLYTETYTTTGASVNSLFASLGLLEDAPAPPEPSGWIGFIQWFWEFF